MTLDETHDPARRAWLDSANTAETDFPIQNLPFGVFRRLGSLEKARVGVAIGDRVLDVAAAGEALAFDGDARIGAEAARAQTLNALAGLGRPVWRALRLALSRALAGGMPSNGSAREKLAPLVAPIGECELLLPFEIGDYTDFYTSVFHATNVGRFFRPDNPLLPNYKWVPIGYHGRASSVVVSGTPVCRPMGQLKPPAADAPVFGICRNLDYEVELGFFVGPGNALGQRVPLGDAAERVFGAVLLNDWSARDIQTWEYQPLGPFLAKSFATTVSPWVVTLEALAPFRVPAFARPAGDPVPLPYLHNEADQREGGFAIEVTMWLQSEKMRAAGVAPQRLSAGNFRDAYWTVAQMLAHHTSNGCNLRPGDLLGSGTVSGATPDSVGSMLELTGRGAKPVALPGGETRSFIADGDLVVQRGRCRAPGAVSIGFGEAAAMLLPAV